MAQEIRFCRGCQAGLAANEGLEIAGGGWGCDDYPKCAEATAPQPVSPSKSSGLLKAFVAGAVWREKHFTGKEMSNTDKQLALTTAECMKAAGVITYVKGL